MSPRPLPPPEVPINPFRNALLIVGIVGLATGIIFGLVGNAEIARTFGEIDGSVQFIWAGIFASIGSVSLLLWLAISAMLWKPGR